MLVPGFNSWGACKYSWIQFALLRAPTFSRSGARLGWKRSAWLSLDAWQFRQASSRIKASASGTTPGEGTDTCPGSPSGNADGRNSRRRDRFKGLAWGLEPNERSAKRRGNSLAQPFLVGQRLRRSSYGIASHDTLRVSAMVLP